RSSAGLLAPQLACQSSPASAPPPSSPPRVSAPPAPSDTVPQPAQEDGVRLRRVHTVAVRDYLKRETQTFFGVQRDNEREQRRLWYERRRRHAARAMGDLRTDLPPDHHPDDDDISMYGASGAAPREARGRVRERPDVLPAPASLEDPPLPPLPRPGKDSVARLTLTGLSYVVTAVTRKSRQSTSAQWSRSFRGSASTPQDDVELDELTDYRPYFTWWVSTVQTLVLLLSLLCYGFGPVGFGRHTHSGQGGGSDSFGGQVRSLHEAGRADSAGHSGLGAERTGHRVLHTERRLGLFCEAPRSIAPHEWPDDITKWPICRKSVLDGSAAAGRSGHAAEHMACEVSCLDDVCGMLPFMRRRRPDQLYRAWTSLFVHAGLLHLATTLALQWLFMRDLEKMAGPVRIAVVYLGSGVIGNMASAIFEPYRAELVGVALTLFTLGLLPWIDNFAHFFGFVFGFLLSYALMPFITFGPYERRRKIVLVWVCMVSAGAMTCALVALFYVAPAYECESCQLFTCLPFAPDMCASQDVRVRQMD
ncbi:Uncharacterized protein OBRU01_03921, partial [Operophtera brumata]